MMNRTEFAELQAFAAIVEQGSFVRAASHLGVSASSLSQTIRRLESRLDTRLFHRTTRSVSSTESGDRFYRDVKPALAALDAAFDSVKTDGDRVAGRLRINASRVAAIVHLAPLLGPFLNEHPDIIVDVVTDDRLIDIVADGFDAGIRLGECLEEDMIAVKLSGDLEMKVVAAPAYLSRHGRPDSPADLITHRCLTFRQPSDGSVYRWEFSREGNPFTVAVSGPLLVDEPAMLTEVALGGAGIGYQFAHQVDEAIARGHLVHLLAEWTPAFPGFFLYYANRRHVPPPLRAFLDFMTKRKRV